jgi:hypothetical protein
VSEKERERSFSRFSTISSFHVTFFLFRFIASQSTDPLFVFFVWFIVRVLLLFLCTTFKNSFMSFSVYICICTILYITVRVIVPSVISFSLSFLHMNLFFFLYVHLMMKKKLQQQQQHFLLYICIKNFYVTIFCLYI